MMISKPQLWLASPSWCRPLNWSILVRTLWTMVPQSSISCSLSFPQSLGTDAKWMRLFDTHFASFILSLYLVVRDLWSHTWPGICILNVCSTEEFSEKKLQKRRLKITFYKNNITCIYTFMFLKKKVTFHTLYSWAAAEAKIKFSGVKSLSGGAGWSRLRRTWSLGGENMK